MPYRQTAVAGIPAIALQSRHLELVVLPTIGGKISHLHRRAGREWLWQSEQIPLALPREGASFAETGDSGGWDECFPTIGASPVPGVPGNIMLPDHGELWSAPWQCTVYERPAGTVFSGTVRGRRLPYEFQREVLLDRNDPVIWVRYRLRHLGQQPFPFVWSAHPLFNVQPGFRLALPGVRRVRVDAVHGRGDVRPGQELAWPPDGSGESFVFPATDRWAMKLFADFGKSGRAVVTDPAGGEQLEVRPANGDIPHIGIWINCHGWAPAGRTPYYNVGLEPCIGAPDRLDEAVLGWKTFGTLEPGEERLWGVEVEVGER